MLLVELTPLQSRERKPENVRRPSDRQQLLRIGNIEHLRAHHGRIHLDSRRDQGCQSIAARDRPRAEQPQVLDPIAGDSQHIGHGTDPFGLDGRIGREGPGPIRHHNDVLDSVHLPFDALQHRSDVVTFAGHHHREHAGTIGGFGGSRHRSPILYRERS